MKTLCLHTANFPYGLGEQFIETEIKYLAKAFERVVLIPAQAEGKKRPLPSNVDLMAPDFSNYTTSKGLQNAGWWIMSCLKDVLKSPYKSTTLSTLLRAGFQANVLFQLLKTNNLWANTLHYTYWFNEQSTLLSILKYKKQTNGFISRAHRFDLYEERNKYGFIPFRQFQLQHVNKLFLISNNGLEYMQEKYPQFKEKYELSYLGIENKLPFSYNEDKKNNPQYLIVSCSRVVTIKRVDLIVKSLAQIQELPIKWVHFGDGPLLHEIKELADKQLPNNIKTEFKGHIDNIDIYNYYNNNNVDCFINVSASEGLPVTLMEAISFGIPIIATNVGGTAEIVTKDTGILLNENPSLTEITQAFGHTLNNYSRTKEFRNKVYSFWEKNFNAVNNYKNFAKKINDFNF